MGAFQFQSFKATESFKMLLQATGEKFNRKKMKEMLPERAEIPAGGGMCLRGAGCSTQGRSRHGLDVC